MLEQPQDPRIAQEVARRAEIANLERRMKAGANNFYWIAGLSVVNSFIFLFNGSLSFVVGLGLTQIVDAFAAVFADMYPASAVLIQVLGLGLSVVLAGFFVLFGIFANKMQRWAFITGMVLYALDAIIMLVFQIWFGFFFHLFFLFGLWTGLQALNQLRRRLPQTFHDPSFPQNIGS